MQKLSLPSASITESVNQLDSLQQDRFYREYKSKKKSSITSFILWFFGIHYLYYREWFFQFLFIITFGGIGIWWLIDLIRLRKTVKNYNHSLAVDLLNRV
ncbi:TM2 domain-containing protein [Akkermansiaceae bacterium]|nr:TM2 domain-containing protein [Akkermansiaceae bacterium]